MNLTPVKGRGKGPRKAGFKQPNPHKKQKLVHDPDSSALEKTHPTSIEDLPKELLEEIMLLSREPNLLLASPAAYQTLRGDHSFLAKIVLSAFEETWDMYFGCVRAHVQSYTGWFEDRARFPGDPEFQSKVVALPFISINHIMAAQQLWIVKNNMFKGRHYQHSGDYDSTDNPGWDYDPERDEKAGFNDGVTMTDGRPHRVRHEGYMRPPKTCFEEEFQSLCFGPFYDHSLGGSMPMRLEVHPEIRIPDRLITGPLTKKEFKLLFWLVHNGAVCKDDQTWEMGLAGARNVFNQNDVDVADITTILLHGAGALRDLPQGILPIPLPLVSEKLMTQKSLTESQTSKRGIGWQGIIERLFDAAGQNDVLKGMSCGL